MDNPKLDAMRKRIAAKGGKIAAVLNTPAGEEFMKELESEFWNGNLIGPTEFATHINLGAREVVRYLREMKAYSERKD
jgi:hypothetical protein